MLLAASFCTPCYMLLGVVVQSFKPVKLLAMCKRTQQFFCCFRLHGALRRFRGSFSNDDGNENVAKKLNWRPFKSCRVYFNQVSLSNVGEFSWSWILLWLYIHVKKEKIKFIVVCSRPPIRKRSNEVLLRSRAVDNGHQRNEIKRMMHAQSCCFALFN